MLIKLIINLLYFKYLRCHLANELGDSAVLRSTLSVKYLKLLNCLKYFSLDLPMKQSNV